VAHGLRSLGSTTLNEQGFNPDAIEAALSHADDNEIRRAYNRSDYFEQRVIMMAWWSNHIEQASQGNLSLASGFKGLKVVGE
jgi:integrase